MPCLLPVCYLCTTCLLPVCYLSAICLPPFCFRWEEERYKDGIKWRFLEHKGPFFPPEYQPLPADVHFYYNGEMAVMLQAIGQ